MIKKRLDQDKNSPLFNWNGSELDPKIFFPWEDVFNSEINSDEITFHVNACPKCLQEFQEINSVPKIPKSKKDFEMLNQNLIFIQFRSPAWTWKHLCGREGILTICTKHKKQIAFILTVMN